MYKQVETDKECILHNGVAFNPVATLAGDGGGRCQIATDDHCYILYIQQQDGKYKHTAWIFKEAFDVLKTLPEIEYGS